VSDIHKASNSAPTDDWQILGKVRSVPGALATLFDRHKDYVFRLAMSVLRQPADAEDVVQQVFVKLANPGLRWTIRAKFRTWLYQVAVNTAREIHRGRRRSERLSGALQDLGETRPPEPPDLLLLDEFGAALEYLSKRQRQVVVMRFLEGMSTRETAVALRISEGSVKTHLHRDTQQLQMILNPNPTN